MEQYAKHITQVFAEQAETRDLLLALITSVMDVCSCVTQIQRFKTSAQLEKHLGNLQPLVNDASDFVVNYRSKLGGAGKTSFMRTTVAETPMIEAKKVKELKDRLDGFKDNLDRSLLVDNREIALSIEEEIKQLRTHPFDLMLLPSSNA
jgi:hypothetical protein